MAFATALVAFACARAPESPRAVARAPTVTHEAVPRPPSEPACPSDPEPWRPPLAKGRVTFPDAPGAPSVDVEVARAPREVERGLMYRSSLGRDRGMIFDWGNERVRTFWMKNTCIPLDMLFLASDGSVVGVLEEVPVLNETPRSVHCPASHVLEVNAGWSRAHGVTPGMKAVFDL